MTVEIDKIDANKQLWNMYCMCRNERVVSCKMKETIDFLMDAARCITYRYIVMTALLAKVCEPNVDIMSLQVKDDSPGSYNARSLASEVVYRFQLNNLGNVLASNGDPLVNNPGRYSRLDPTNVTARGDPQKALELICRDLPRIDTQEDAGLCLKYMISSILDIMDKKKRYQTTLEGVAKNRSITKIRHFLDGLLDQGFGGASLVLVTTALYRLHYKDKTYSVVPHPVNQAGTSSRQFSDLDLLLDDKAFMGTELKDKAFTPSDLNKAANIAYKAHASGLLFVAGRLSNFASQPSTHFSEVKDKYAEKGMYVGLTSIDALMDTILTSHANEDLSCLFIYIQEATEKIRSVEAQNWIYNQIMEMDSDTIIQF